MLATSFLLYLANNFDSVEEKFVVYIHRGRCSNKVHYVLPHDVVTWDGDHDVSF